MILQSWKSIVYIQMSSKKKKKKKQRHICFHKLEKKILCGSVAADARLEVEGK